MGSFRCPCGCSAGRLFCPSTAKGNKLVVSVFGTYVFPASCGPVLLYTRVYRTGFLRRSGGICSCACKRFLWRCSGSAPLLEITLGTSVFREHCCACGKG